MSVSQRPDVRAALAEVNGRRMDLDDLLQQSGTPGWEARMDAAQEAFRAACDMHDSIVRHAELEAGQ
jgi:hypothetical protein